MGSGPPGTDAVNAGKIMRTFGYVTRIIGLLCGLGLLLWLVLCQEIWALVLAVPLLAVPGMLALATRSALNKGHALRVYRDGGVMQRLLSGAGWRLLFSYLASFAAVLFGLPQLLNMGIEEGLLLIVAPVVFWLGLGVARRVALSQLAAPHASVRALSWAMWPSVGVLLALSLGLELSLAQSLETPLNRTLDATPPSTLVQELRSIAELGEALQVKLSHSITGGGWLAPLVTVILTKLGFCLFALSLSACAAIPPAELRRAFAPASDADSPPPVRASTLGWTGFMGTLLLMSWLVGAATLDGTLLRMAPSQRPSVWLTDAATLFVKVEQIAGESYQPGTIAALRDIAREAGSALEEQHSARLEGLINAAADGMIANTDVFLDGYYSIFAEYMRLGRMLVGGLDEALTEDLQAALGQGPAPEALASALASLNAEGLVQEIAQGTSAEISTLLERARVVVPTSARREVVAQCDAPPCLDLSLMAAQLEQGFSERLLAGGAAGAAGGVVAAVVVKKVAAKGTIKLAAKALTKVLTSKAVAGSGGVAIGALIGSVIPVAGTVIGGVIGGLVAGVGADFLMLKLEENWQRDAFRAQIVQEIESWRLEALAELAAPR